MIIKEIDVLFIQYLLGYRKIIKIENNIDYFSRFINRYIDKYGLRGKVSTLFFHLDDYKCLIIGKNKADVRYFLHNDTYNSSSRRVLLTGRMLGYPDCCIKKYAKLSEKYGDSQALDNYYISKNLNKLNDINVLHMMCSPDCAKTARIYKKVSEYYLK